jgi:hypothetical protein
MYQRASIRPPAVGLRGPAGLDQLRAKEEIVMPLKFVPLFAVTGGGEAMVTDVPNGSKEPGTGVILHKTFPVPVTSFGSSYSGEHDSNTPPNPFVFIINQNSGMAYRAIRPPFRRRRCSRSATPRSRRTKSGCNFRHLTSLASSFLLARGRAVCAPCKRI